MRKPKPNLIEIIKNLHYQPVDRRLLYQRAWEKRDFKTLEDIASDYLIRCCFRFLGTIYEDKVQNQSFHQLPLPVFPTDRETFEDVVKQLTRTSFRRGLLKSFGTNTKEFGTLFLNNVHGLVEIYPLEKLNFDRLVNLNHERVLKPQMVQLMKGKLIPILEHYTVERMFTVLCNSTPSVIADTELLLTSPDLDLELIRRTLPRKPKTLLEIHDLVSRISLRQKRKNWPLKQKIEVLDGDIIQNHIIEVPKDTFDLISTSEELRHCVHGYDRTVIQGGCQILNLVKDHRRKYTIELRPEGSGYKVAQFKGKGNDATMEGPQGAPFVRELQSLLKSKLAA